MILKNVASQIVQLGSLIKTSDGSRLTSSATVRWCKDGTWANGGGTLSVEETDQNKYLPTQAETNCDLWAISVDHTDAIQPLVLSGRTMLARAGELSATERTAIQDASRRLIISGLQGTNPTPSTSTVTLSTVSLAGLDVKPGYELLITHDSDGTIEWTYILTYNAGTGVITFATTLTAVSPGADLIAIYSSSPYSSVWANTNRTVTLADGVTHGGTTAKLRLGSNSSTPALYITNSGGHGFRVTASGGNGAGLLVEGNGTAPGFEAIGGATGPGGLFWGGATSGDGLQAIAGGGGHGLVATAIGSSKHGALVTGGNGGTSDGLKLVAGTGGVSFRIDVMAVGTNNIAWNSAWDSHVQADCTAALSAEAGAGPDQVTIPIQKDGTDPVVDAQVWVTSDSAGHSVVAGPLRTNSEGEVVFLLTDGDTYYLWMKADGVDSINGQQFVAEAD